MITAEAIARALASDEVAGAIESAIERMQVEQIYGLGGGELEREPLPYVDGSGRESAFHYHYDGVPEWCASDFDDCHDGNVEYFTMIQTDDPYGRSPEEVTTPDGKRYFRVAVLRSGGESDCPMGPHGWGEKTVNAGTDTEGPDGFISCPYCEAEEGEKHSVVYLGTGAEVVYKHVEFECAICGESRADCVVGHIGQTNTDLIGECSCADSNPEA